MNVDVTMPQLGETVAEGTITRWLRQVGDLVTDQEPLLEISTDKVDTEVPAPAAGRLLRIVVPEDSTVSVGTVLAVIASEATADAVDVPRKPDADPALAGVTRVGAPPSRRRHVHTPKVRRLAAEAGLTLGTLRGTGPGGRVTVADVVAADRTVPSERVAAQPTSVVEVDVTRVVALHHAAAPDLLQRLGLRLTLSAFFAKAALEALRTYPVLNVSAGDHRPQHLGVALDTDRGALVPVLRDAGDLSLLGLSRRIEDLAVRAGSGSLGPSDLTGATFTLADAGGRGVLFDTPVLAPGQVGILGTGAVVERPAVVRQADGERVIAVRSIAYLALTYDHRLVDGAYAARFLAAVKDRLGSGQFRDELG